MTFTNDKKNRGGAKIWLRVSHRFAEKIKARAVEDGITISQAVERYATFGLSKATPRREAVKQL